MKTKLLTFHHIGIATKNIARTKRIFENFGLRMSEAIHVPSQRVNVCFSQKGGHPQIELIEPAEKDSPIHNILNKVGTTPCHFCYQTPELDQASKYLKEHGFLLINGPSRSNALDDNRICFFYNKHFGLIEVVEIKKDEEE
jgi:methylmalonyl-CoA/ethylmalonyl-CoA epimerase